MPERAILAVILDGVGDRPHPSFGEQTPLQAAQIPVLDELASTGATGLIDPLGPGIVPGSGTGHLGLFDYDPLAPTGENPSRGCIEALGLGLEPEQGAVAARGNFVTVDEEGRIVDRRAGRFQSAQDHEEATELVEVMNAATAEDVSFHYHPRMAYRFVVVLRDGSPDVTDTDPAATGRPRATPEATSEDPDASETAQRLQEALEAASKAIADDPVNEARRARDVPEANAIVTRGLGEMRRGTTMEERFGLDARAIAGGNAYRGIAGFVGMELVDVPGATGDVDSDLDAKVRAARSAFEDGADLVYVHIKAPDICGENGDFEAKRDVIEDADAALEPVLDLEETVVGITGDHSTPCVRASHSGDPVPLIVNGPGVRVDGIDRYDEIACASGGLGRLQGGDFLRTLLDLADRTKKTE